MPKMMGYGDSVLYRVVKITHRVRADGKPSRTTTVYGPYREEGTANGIKTRELKAHRRIRYYNNSNIQNVEIYLQSARVIWEDIE